MAVEVDSLIGRLASSWAHLEHTLVLIIWDLAGIEQARAACVTAQILDATNRYKTIISLLKQRNDRKFAESAVRADELMRKTFDPQEARNRIIHDAWYITYKKLPAQFRAMPTKDQRFGICEIDAKQIEAVIGAAIGLAERASTLRNEILSTLTSSQKSSG